MECLSLIASFAAVSMIAEHRSHGVSGSRRTNGDIAESVAVFAASAATRLWMKTNHELVADCL